MKTPEYYRAPLKSRAAITAWLLARVESNPRKGYGLFCYNVKLHTLNTDFDHAVKLARESGALPCDSARYLAECRAIWEDGRSDTAFEIGTQDACERITEDDTNRMLWDGSRAVAQWEFNGRSSGWLCLKEFDGVDFPQAVRASCMSQTDWAAEFFAEQPFTYLRRLYRFIVQCDHDFRRPESEVEYLAADWFFANAVDGIETDAQQTARLAKEQAEQSERAHWEARDTVTT